MDWQSLTIIIKKISQVQLYTRMTIETLQINMYEQHIPAATTALTCNSSQSRCGCELSVGFYNGVQVVFSRCHDSFEMSVMTKTSLPPHKRKWQAMLSLMHKTTVALSVYLSVRMKAALRSPLMQIFKINSENSFHFDRMWLTRGKKPIFLLSQPSRHHAI